MAAHDLHAVAFPKLDAAQLAVLDRCPLTRCRRYRAGETIFSAGERDCVIIVVKSGEVEIIDDSGETSVVQSDGVATARGGARRPEIGRSSRRAAKKRMGQRSKS